MNKAMTLTKSNQIEDMRMLMNELSRICPEGPIYICWERSDIVITWWQELPGYNYKVEILMNIINTSHGGRKPVCVDTESGEIILDI